MSGIESSEEVDQDRVLAELRAQLASVADSRGSPPVPDESGTEEPLSDADAESVARGIVLRQLTAQAKTRTELSRALRRKNVPQEAADAVLNRMEEVGLVDDAGFAQAWVDSRQQRRHLSATALRYELRGKGVAQEHVDSALSEVGADEEYTAALALAERKLASMRGHDRATIRRRLSGVLGRKGFGTGLIVRVLGEVLDRVDED